MTAKEFVAVFRQIHPWVERMTVTKGMYYALLNEVNLEVNEEPGDLLLCRIPVTCDDVEQAKVAKNFTTTTVSW